MSYVNMDHAGWVQTQIDCIRQSERKRQERGLKPARTDRGWLSAPEKLTPFQRRVCDLLGIVFGGIYNAPISWDTVEWRYGRGVAVTITYRSLSTWDFSQLTMLVFLCHEGRIRGEIEPAGPRGMRLAFWERQATGGMGARHPNLDEAIASFRKAMPADHPIFYREELDGPQLAEVAENV